MKRCPRCQETKPLSEIQGSGYCKPCNREYGRENYRQNKDRYFAQAKKRDAELDRLIRSRKDVPCADCGVRYPHYVMDFDHLRDKEFGVCEMRRRRMAVAKIVAEMDKCEVVCSNCHRVRTYMRAGGSVKGT